MGSYNQTCGLTQLPISSGQKVVAFILEKTYEMDHATGTSYPTDLWAPFSLPLYGEYDDYGSLEGIDSDSFSGRHLIASVNDHYKLIGDKAITNADVAVEYINNASREAQNRSDWNLGLVMFEAGIWRRMVDWIAHARHWYRDETFRELLLGELMNTRRPFEFNSDGMRSLPKNPGGIIPPLPEQTVFDAILGHGANIFTFARTNNEAQRAILDLCLTNILLVRSRKMWMPQSGQGSQQDDLDVYAELADATKEYIDAEIKRRKNEGWYE